MKSNIFLILLVGTITFSYGQTLKIQDLLGYSQIDASSDFGERLAHKGYTFSKTYGNPKVDLYLSKIEYEASSKKTLLRSNRITLIRNNGIHAIGFTTVNKSLYTALLQELKSEGFGYVAQETKEHSFRDGVLTIYTSEVLPEIEIEVIDVIVHENVNGKPTENWRRYEFQLTYREN